MARAGAEHQIRTEAYALSNTGPLISAFQAESFDLLRQLFAEVRISSVCAGELVRHGWEAAVQAATPHLVIVKLTREEEQQTQVIAEQIAQHSSTNDPVVANHLGEAQVMTRALRSEHRDDVLLLDELAARAIAKQLGIHLSGFPGFCSWPCKLA